MSGRPTPPAQTEADRRGARRFGCEVQTTCQPPSAWARDPWPAVIRDISTGGISLRLGRRFERGSGLAIELPTEDGGTTTVLARISHVEQGEGAWLLGCTFISELSDEEVRTVLDLDPLHHASLADPDASEAEGPSVRGVLFQARLRGCVVRWYVRRLDPSGGWPPRAGKVVSFRVPDGEGGTCSAELVLTWCRQVGANWVIDCRFRQEPSEVVLQALLPTAVA